MYSEAGISKDYFNRLADKHRAENPVPPVNSSMALDYREQGDWSLDFQRKVFGATGISISGLNLTPGNIQDYIGHTLVSKGLEIDTRLLEGDPNDPDNQWLYSVEGWRKAYVEKGVNAKLQGKIDEDILKEMMFEASDVYPLSLREKNAAPPITASLREDWYQQGYKLENLQIEFIEKATGLKLKNIEGEFLDDIFSGIAYGLLEQKKRVRLSNVEGFENNQYYGSIANQLKMIDEWLGDMYRKFSDKEIGSIIRAGTVKPPFLKGIGFGELPMSSQDLSFSNALSHYEQTGNALGIKDGYEDKVSVKSSLLEDEIFNTFRMEQEWEAIKRISARDGVSTDEYLGTNRANQEIKQRRSEFLDMLKRNIGLKLPIIGTLNWIKSTFTQTGYREYYVDEVIREQLVSHLPKELIQRIGDEQLDYAVHYYQRYLMYGDNFFGNLSLRNAEAIILGSSYGLGEEDEFRAAYRAWNKGLSTDFNTRPSTIFGKSIDSIGVKTSAFLFASAITGGVFSLSSPLGIPVSGGLSAASFEVLDKFWKDEDEDLYKYLKDIGISYVSGHIFSQALAGGYLPQAETYKQSLLNHLGHGSIAGYALGLNTFKDETKSVSEQMKSLGAITGLGAFLGGTLFFVKRGFSNIAAAKLSKVFNGVPKKHQDTVNEILIEAADGENLKPEDIIDRIVNLIENNSDIPEKQSKKIIEAITGGLQHVSMEGDIGYWIVRDKSGTSTIYSTNTGRLVRGETFSTYGAAALHVNKLIAGGAAEANRLGRLLTLHGGDLQREVYNANKGIVALSSKATRQLAANEPVSLSDIEVLFIRNQAEAAGLPKENIDRFFRDFETIASRLKNPAVLEQTKHKMLTGFLNKISNSMMGGFNQKLLQSIRSDLSGLVLEVEKIDKGYTKTAKAFSEDIIEAVKNLNTALDKPLKPNILNSSFLFEAKSGGALKNFQSSLEKISKTYKTEEAIEIGGKFVSDIIDGIINQLDEVFITGIIDSDSIFALKQSTLVLKALGNEEARQALLYNKERSQAFIDMVKRGITERSNVVKKKNILSRQMDTPMHWFRNAFGEEAGDFFLGAEIGGAEATGDAYFYAQKIARDKSKEYGIALDKAFNKLEDTVKIPKSYVASKYGTDVSTDTVELTYDNLAELVSTLSDPEAANALITSDKVLLTGKDGKLIELSIGLRDETLLSERKLLRDTEKLLSGLKSTGSKSAEFRSNLLKQIKDTISKGGKPDKRLVSILETIEKSVDGVDLSIVNRDLTEAIDELRSAIGKHVDKHGWTNYEMVSHYKQTRKSIEAARKAIETAPKEATKVQMALLEADYQALLREYSRNPLVNGELASFMLEDLMYYVPKEVQMLLDIRASTTSWVSEKVNEASINTFGIPIFNRHNYYPIARHQTGNVGGQATSLLHQGMFKPPVGIGATGEIRFKGFSKTWFDTYTKSAYAAGSMEELYMIERLINDPEFKLFITDEAIKNPFYENAIERLKDGLSLFGSSRHIDEFSKAIAQPIQKIVAMQMSNLNARVATAQLTSIFAAKNVGIEFKYLVDPSNIAHFNKDNNILYNDPFFYNRLVGGNFHANTTAKDMGGVLITGGSPFASIQAADQAAITTIFSAALSQKAKELGLDRYSDEVITAAKELTKKSTILTQPYWKSITSSYYTKYRGTALIMTPYRTATNASWNAMMMSISEGRAAEGVAAFLATQSMYAVNRTIHKGATYELARMFNEYYLGTFPSEDFNHFREFLSDWTDVLADSLPYSGAAVSTLTYFYRKSLDEPTMKRSIFGGNMFERTFILPADEILSSIKKVKKDYEIKGSIDQTFKYNPQTDRFDVYNREGKIVMQGINSPIPFILDSIYKYGGKEVFDAMSDDTKVRQIKMLTKSMQYLLAFSGNPNAAFAVNFGSDMLFEGGDNTIFTTNVYDYAAQMFGYSKPQTRDLMINTMGRWNAFKSKVNKERDTTSEFKPLEGEAKLYRHNIAGAIYRSMNDIESVYTNIMNVAEESIVSIQLAPLFSQTINKASLEANEREYLKALKAMSDELREYQNLLNYGSSKKYKMNYDETKAWRLVDKQQKKSKFIE